MLHATQDVSLVEKMDSRGVEEVEGMLSKVKASIVLDIKSKTETESSCRLSTSSHGYLLGYFCF